MPINPLEQFVDQILKQVKLESLPKDFKASYKEKLMAETQRRIGILAVQELDEKGLEKYRQLIEKDSNPSPQVIQDFFTSHIENFEEKMRKGLENFAREFIEASQR